MRKTILILSLLFLSITANAQTTRCVGNDTLCLELMADTTICSATKLSIIAKATSSVTGANITYVWKNLSNNSPLSIKDSLNHIFSSTSITNIDVEIHAQYDTFNVYDTIKVTVNPLPIISLRKPYLTEACFTESIYLNAFNTTPTGGTWHHWDDTTAINNNSFLPGKVGTKENNGVYDLIYISTNTYGCTDSNHTKIKILRLPPVKVNGAGPFCDNIGSQELLPFVKQPASPSLGGQHWSSLTQPDGVYESNGKYYFNPNGGLKGQSTPNKLKYTFTDLTTGCYDSDTMHVIVNAATYPQYNNPGVHCASGKELNIDSLYNINPAGGKWSCANCNGFNPVIDSIKFDPSARPSGFTYQLQYKLYYNGCSSTDLVILKTKAVPQLNVSADDYNACENDGTINLHAAPFGGIWSGKGVTDSAFYVNQGDKGDTNTLTYSYFDATLACPNYADVNIVIWEHPVINLSLDKDPICDNDSNYIYASYGKSVSNISWAHLGNGYYLNKGDSILYHPNITDTLNGVMVYATGSNPGCADSTVSVNFSVLNCSKVSVPSSELVLITIYPNPASDNVTLQKDEVSAFRISLISTDGRVLKNMNWEKNNTQLTIKRNGLPDGVYYILLMDNKGNQYRHKLILN